jgi:hypothetical protein
MSETDIYIPPKVLVYIRNLERDNMSTKKRINIRERNREKKNGICACTPTPENANVRDLELPIARALLNTI